MYNGGGGGEALSYVLSLFSWYSMLPQLDTQSETSILSVEILG